MFLRQEEAKADDGNQSTHRGHPLAVVSLEDLVPNNHFYRHLDRVLDLSFVRELVKTTYAHGGRPSIDPVVFWHHCNW